jgi:hypothetical protein
MRWLTALGLVVLAVVFASTAVGAPPTGSGGIGFEFAIPHGEFRDNVDNTGYGVSVFLMVWIPGTPVAIGGSGGVVEYGSEKRETPWSTTIPDVFVDVTTTNKLASGHLFLRLQPTSGFFRPYVEGLIGLNYLWTRTSVKDQGDGEEIAGTTHLSDLTFSYGVGAGITFRVWSPQVQGPLDEDAEELLNTDASAEEGLESFGLFVDVRYLKGGEADYLTKGSIQIEDGEVEYDVRHSRTDMVSIRLGISVSFL